MIISPRDRLGDLIDHGSIMNALKSFLTSIEPRWWTTLIFLIAISISCSTSKSAGPQSQITEGRLATPAPIPIARESATQGGACTLKMAEAPAIKGLKLGMTVEQILALFPGSKQDSQLTTSLSTSTGRFGNSTFVITPSKYGSAANYKEVSGLNFSMLDGHISNFTINYSGPQWENVDQFIEKFNQGKNLPSSDHWEPYAGMETQMKTLTCDGFSIRIFAGGEGGNLNYVLVQDLEADKKLKDRRKKAREQASPTPAASSTPNR